jgi:hypothetical protein
MTLLQDLALMANLRFQQSVQSKSRLTTGGIDVRFDREIDGDTINAPCFSLKGLEWLSALSDRASGFPIMKTLDYLIKLVHPSDEASAWLRDHSWESPS